MNLETVIDQLQGDPELPEDLTQEAIRRVYAAEKAAQGSWVRYEGERPADLDSALLARVRHNLLVDGGQEPVRRIGIGGEGVRDLEFPYSPRGRAADDAAATGSENFILGVGKTATKKAAKKATARKRAAKKAPGTPPAGPDSEGN